MSHQPALPLVLALDDPAATLETTGGKGASLARMAAADLPIPPGFHVTTAAYRRFVAAHDLQPQILAAVATADPEQPATLETASQQIAALFERPAMPDAIATAIRAAYAELGDDLPVAVRSSATAEDLPGMSFAGQQESFLNMRGAKQVLQAVQRCWASLWTARAIGYRARHGIRPEEVSLAVVVQQLVPADAAGILFTANPLTGARDQLMINAAWGLGEAIVGGQVTPDTLVLDKASGAIIEQQINDKELMTVRTERGTHEQPVPADQRTRAVLSPAQAAELARLGVAIEQLYGQPMDIEWALHDGQTAIVQARPITALRGDDAADDPWNDSRRGDYLWTNANLGEAMPNVMTPCTWSLMQIFMADTMVIGGIDEHPLVGNIGGRAYINVSVLATLAAAFGMGTRRFAEANQQVFGRMPQGLEPPLIAVSRRHIIRTILPDAARLRWRVATHQQQLDPFLATAAARCDALRARIQATASSAELRELWQAELLPFFHECSQMLEIAARRNGTAIVWVRTTLGRLVGEADTNALLSGLSRESSPLASLGPLLGLTQLQRGEIDPATFARQYGHRSPQELEVSSARPGEDPDWIERQLAGLRDVPLDVPALLARQQQAQADAWQRFRARYPRRVRTIQRRIEQAAEAFRYREAARSEVVRVFWALRDFVLRAGALSGLSDDVFFLSIHEILALLDGEQTALAAIAERRATYERYTALPSYPVLIRGRFDPFAWAADPQRRSDLFDAHGTSAPASPTISGFPGAAGVVEGRVRVLANADQADQLQPGEILVATVTNVGWTPLFPRAAAVITDIGAPLSHAAIVARELGIPAVVGCGNATMRLRSGDLVRVDGSQGTVELLSTVDGRSTEPAASAAPAALDWAQLPQADGQYMRSSVLELLPDPLSPLFATLGLPAWSRAMHALLATFDASGVMPEQGLTTINGYGYYDLTLSTAQKAKMALLVPRMLGQLPHLMGSAQSRWQQDRARYAALVARWQTVDRDAAPAAELLDGARQLVDEAATYYLTVQSGLLPAAYMSEALFTQVYDRLIKRRDDPPALTFVLGFDSAPIQAEKSLYDLAQWARQQPELVAGLTAMSSAQFTAAYHARSAAAGAAVWGAFWQRLDQHLARFGHTIYDLDFAKAVLSDEPAPLLETLKFFISGAAPDPHARQAAAQRAREQATARLLTRTRGLRLISFWRLVRLAQTFAPLREDALADVGLGWPLLRRMLHQLGQRLRTHGALAQPGDVFWLTLAELEQAVAALDASQTPATMQAVVAERRELWQRQHAHTPPVALPLKGGTRFLGIDFRSMLPAHMDQPDADRLTGVAASPGHVSGPARVIHGPEQFAEMRQGDVLVARITTPAWTPLFALASAVVTDVGGPLSHSSIVAREYHIPAVLGTGVATERLHSGQRILVDGDAGTVTVAS